MKDTYRAWLEQRYEPGTVQTQQDRVKRLEKYYGDLDDAYDKDGLEELYALFKYSADDERNNRPNPSLVPIAGNLRKGLSSCRNAIAFYKNFRADIAGNGEPATAAAAIQTVTSQIEAKKTVEWLERDMQAALRKVIGQLEDGLEIIDEGAERAVTSGLIDITARDKTGAIVVIELKTGTARDAAIGQILSYMADVAEEEAGMPVRGILVAADFDKKVRSAVRLVPNLMLKKYQINFTFSDGRE